MSAGGIVPISRLSSLQAAMGPGAFWVFGMVVTLSATLAARPQVIEEFYPAHGAAPFGRQADVAGGFVIWQRAGPTGSLNPGLIQCQDVRLLGAVVVGVADYPTEVDGPFLAGDLLFYGVGGGAPNNPFGFYGPVRAQRLGRECSLLGPPVQVNDFGRVIGVSSEHVFIRVGEYEAEPHRNRIYAKPLADLGAPGRDALVHVTTLGNPTMLLRTEAASDRYFVWQERAMSEDTWKIHVLDLSRPLVGQEPRVIDTMRHWSRGSGGTGAYLDLHGSYLVFEGGKEPTPEAPWGIYFIDLDGDGTRYPIVATTEPHDFPSWPAVSADFVVWVRRLRFFEREAFGMRIIDGLPTGEIFSLGPNQSWIHIDGTLTVGNGATDPAAGLGVQPAIVVRELDLPGACDVGDADLDGRVSVTDAVVILRHLFGGGLRPRLRLADTDRSRTLDASDAVVILNYLFRQGPPPGDCRRS
jgi:hypothetical protein